MYICVVKRLGRFGGVIQRVKGWRGSVCFLLGRENWRGGDKGGIPESITPPKDLTQS